MRRFRIVFRYFPCKFHEKYSYNVCIFRNAVLYSHCHRECARDKLCDRTATCLSKVLTLDCDGITKHFAADESRPLFYAVHLTDLRSVQPDTDQSGSGNRFWQERALPVRRDCPSVTFGKASSDSFPDKGSSNHLLTYRRGVGKHHCVPSYADRRAICLCNEVGVMKDLPGQGRRTFA